MNQNKKPTTKIKANQYWHNAARWRKYDSETAMWKDLYQIPKSIKDVARMVNVSYGTVRKRMLLCKVQPRRRGTYRTLILDGLENDGINIYKICIKEGSVIKASEKIGVHYNTLRKWLHIHNLPKFANPGRPPLDEKIIEEIHILRSQGFSVNAISFKLDIRDHVIWRHCKRRTKS